MTAGSQWHKNERLVLALAGETTARRAWDAWQKQTDPAFREMARQVFIACVERVR